MILINHYFLNHYVGKTRAKSYRGNYTMYVSCSYTKQKCASTLEENAMTSSLQFLLFLYWSSIYETFVEVIIIIIA